MWAWICCSLGFFFIHCCWGQRHFSLVLWCLFLQHCAYCKRLGASIKCCAEGCAQLYHYPCAGAAGTFQDIRSLSLLCPEHIELAIHKCKLGAQIKQWSCVIENWINTMLPSMRFSFISPTLFISLSTVVDDVNCALCDSPGDLQDQLFCTSCGQHYHGMCLDMAVTPLRRAGWQCPECKICQTCKWVIILPPK